MFSLNVPPNSFSLFQLMQYRDRTLVTRNNASESCDFIGVFCDEFLKVRTRSRIFTLSEFENISNPGPSRSPGSCSSGSNKCLVQVIDGFLRKSDSSDSIDCVNWIRSIKIAKNIYDINVVLTRAANHQYFLEMTKDVEPYEELFLWFSNEIVQELRIPHLAPINIQGQYKYWCQHCQKTFDEPNPLKIHLAVGCHFDYSMDILWKRLDMLSPATLSIPRPLKLLPQISPIDDSSTTTTALSLEAMVSNLGSTKHGHLCIYCGKYYSRKYGLKIHIRTHTNFKPLKCKFCLRQFGDPSNLNKHIRLHSRNISTGNYRCKECGKILIRRRDLERHMQTRHNSTASDCKHKS